MKQTAKSKHSKKNSFSDRFLTEVSYHKNLRPILIFAALPCFIFFTFYHFLRDNPFSGTIFVLLVVNAMVSLIWSSYVKDIKTLTKLNIIGLSIAFVLLALVIVIEMFAGDIYVAIPWVFIYPAIILLMMGERVGILGAVAYVAAIIGSLLVLDLPPWSDASKVTFKLHIAFALIAMLIYTLVAERSRVRMRDNLLEARDKHKRSEEIQRQTNEDLRKEIEMRLNSEEALSQSEIRYRALFEESAVSLWEENQSELKHYLDNLPKSAMDNLEDYLNHHRDELTKYFGLARITAVNRATLELYEAFSLQDLWDNIAKILPSDIAGWTIGRISALYRNANYESQLDVQTIKGRKLNVLLSSTVPVGYEDSWERVYTSVYDITDRVAVEEEKRRVEEQFQHTRQIQAVASLAGGIAHQFNNALAAISGNLELLEHKLESTSITRPHFASLYESADQMRHLTEQLLAYARGGKYQPADFAAEALIQKLLTSNKDLKNSEVVFKTDFERNIVISKSDITQIQMVLEAVISNAVEAMDGNGEVTISTRSIRFEEEKEPAPLGLASGSYVLITIEDKGIGMDEETCRHIFEPFFSTKFVGRGLGLAAANGVVHNHGGIIDVDSTLGEGTRVMVYLPSVTPAH